MKTISICWKTLVRKWYPAAWRSVNTWQRCTPGRGHPSGSIKSSYVSVSGYSSRNLAKCLDKHITKDCYPCYQNIWKDANVFAMGEKQIKTTVICSTHRPSSREAWSVHGATGAPELLAGCKPQQPLGRMAWQHLLQLKIHPRCDTAHCQVLSVLVTLQSGTRVASAGWRRWDHLKMNSRTQVCWSADPVTP